MYFALYDVLFQVVVDAGEVRWSDDDFGDADDGGNDINLDDLNLDDEDWLVIGRDSQQ